MPCPFDFLPPHIIELTNLVTRVHPYTRSPATSRLAMCPFLGISSKSSSAHDAQLTTPVPVQAHRPGTSIYFLPLAAAAPALPRLAPYFDRLCERLATPTESSVPRTTW